MDKPNDLIPASNPKPRVSAKLLRAIALRAEGRSILSACREAGLSESGWHAAMKKLHVREMLEEQALLFVQQGARLRAVAATRGLEVALELLETAKSEPVRAKLAVALMNINGDARSSVSIHMGGPRPYVYHRPKRFAEAKPVEDK